MVIVILIKNKQDLHIQKTIIIRDGLILIITQVLLLYFISDAFVTFFEAFILLAIYISYVIFLSVIFQCV